MKGVRREEESEGEIRLLRFFDELFQNSGWWRR